GPDHVLSGGVIPENIRDVWSQIPGVFINVVFATLFLGKQLPTVAEMWRLAKPQIMFGQTMARGQYVVGILLAILVLTPLFGLNPLAGALIEISFEGGHGTAAGLMDTFEQLGFPEGADLALGLATFSLVAGTVLGTIIVNWGARTGQFGRTRRPAGPQAAGVQAAPEAAASGHGAAPPGHAGEEPAAAAGRQAGGSGRRQAVGGRRRPRAVGGSLDPAVRLHRPVHRNRLGHPADPHLHRVHDDGSAGRAGADAVHSALPSVHDRQHFRAAGRQPPRAQPHAPPTAHRAHLRHGAGRHHRRGPGYALAVRHRRQLGAFRAPGPGGHAVEHVLLFRAGAPHVPRVLVRAGHRRLRPRHGR